MQTLPDTLCYLNGEDSPLHLAKVSVLDRGFIFGDGIYEVVPAYGGRLFRFGPVVSVSKMISRIGRPYIDPPGAAGKGGHGPFSRKCATSAATRARVWSSRTPVSMIKSARARVSASGTWSARILSNYSAVIPGRARTRLRWTAAGAETTATASSLVCPVFS